MPRQTIPDSEIPEIEQFIKEQQAKDIQCWSFSSVNGQRFKLVYRPSTENFVVIDTSDNTNPLEYHYEFIRDAVEKYNSL